MRVVLIVFFMLASTLAWAEWVKVSEIDAGVAYIDPATIGKDGNLRRVWAIQDLKQRHPNGELSRRLLHEYDCAERRRRSLSTSAHTERMATGEVLSSSIDPGNWHPVAPGTVDEAMLKIVCAR